MQSQNYKILNDSIDFGRIQEGWDNYQIQKEIGLASTAQMAGKTIPSQFILVLLVIGFLLLILLKKQHVKKT